MEVLHPTAAADTARLQARVDQLEAHVARLESERAALRWMAGHDALTGLANRRLFHALAPTLLSGNLHATVLILDLDGFKPINDTYGHEIGDMVLCVIGGRIASCLGADSLVARFGGDEFAALLTGRSADCEAAAATLRDAISPPMTVAGHTLSVSASIGLVPAGRSTDVADLLRRADQAMYQAKRRTRSTGRPGTAWIVAVDGGSSAPGGPYRRGDTVWVNRNGVRRAGVVESASDWAALVRFRCSDASGTVVDTIPVGWLGVRDEADPHLDRAPAA
ncbi:GGDEF domain-containing protein [Phytohabitans aurantiacus]|jgi:diguanylate cyclase (GGDEF)-like protein|uniref:GGDEF domain-containing protein n=1 Tax=Phytohabitans aurantiacus TaxID=3016789 RepID=A0ABQ5R3I5_9ACTN|nr:GGDEF domain-containing protein [Phytohabitans aurantiacus]GLI01354.1 hypothetical protein Pa4123_66300 [Phytohabitans aurantiacus]